MAGRRSQGLERDPKTGPGNLAGVDGIAYGDGVVAAAHIACRGEALLQHGANIDCGIEGAIDVRMGEPVFGGIGAAGQLRGDMHMTVDEARHDGGGG